MQRTVPGKDPRAVVTADFNADQRLDLAFVALDDQSINVLLGNGDGTFQSPVAYHASTAPLAIAVTDVDQDGKIDLAASPSPLISDGGYFLMGNGDGTCRQGPPVIPFVAVADFSNDGKLDVVGKHCTISIFHPPGTCAFSLLLGNGDGTFQSALAVGQPVGTTADFDGDGKLDITGVGSDREIKIGAGNGDGTFQSPISFPNGGSISLGTDVTGDHAPDIVMITGPNSIGVLVNIGTDVSITSSTPTPSTLSEGQSATSTLNLSLLTKFDNRVALSCSVHPLKRVRRAR
jgi:FG-GAP-like repeat